MPEQDAKDFIWKVIDSYLKRKAHHNLNIDDRNIFKNVISMYMRYVEKPSFMGIIEIYKQLYIFNEAQVEDNITKEELEGLGEVYDYISNFDYSKNKFNLFTTSLMIHIKLYSKCVGKEFGGKLRDNTAILYDTNYEVPDAEIAKKYFNSLIPVSDQIFQPLFDGDIFAYIENCIKLTVTLIKYQPFADGNKRVFRALLNLLLKRIGILPVYISIEEREIYKKALLKAIKQNDYNDIINFYYFKICESIMTLDLKHTKFYEEPVSPKSKM